MDEGVTSKRKRACVAPLVLGSCAWGFVKNMAPCQTLVPLSCLELQQFVLNCDSSQRALCEAFASILQ